MNQDEYRFGRSMTSVGHALKCAAALFVVLTALLLGSDRRTTAQAPIQVLLVTGQSNRYHNWEVSSPIVKRQLEESGRFAVTVESSCFNDPAAALRGLANTGCPCSSRSRFIC